MRLVASTVWMCVFITSFAAHGVCADEKNAPSKVPQAATVSGKYSELLKIVSVPADEATFGKFCDYGYDSSPEWGGHTNLPPGFWVYVTPNWYIWKNSKAVDVQAHAGVASDEFAEYIGHQVSIEMEGHNTSITGTVLATGAQFLTVQMTEPRPKKLLVNKGKILYVVLDDASRAK